MIILICDIDTLVSISAIQLCCGMLLGHTSLCRMTAAEREEVKRREKEIRRCRLTDDSMLLTSHVHYTLGLQHRVDSLITDSCSHCQKTCKKRYSFGCSFFISLSDSVGLLICWRVRWNWSLASVLCIAFWSGMHILMHLMTFAIYHMHTQLLWHSISQEQFR